jgi:hypothetical protein
VTDHVNWLEIAAAGMGLLGLAMTGWYTAAKYSDRVRADADRKLAYSVESPKVRIFLGQPEEDDAATDAEEILGARMVRFNEPFLDSVAGWWRQLWRRLRPLGWLRVPVLVPASLALLTVYLVLCVLLLPLIVAGYLFDVDNDFRLRIIVLAFALGTAFEIMAAANG